MDLIQVANLLDQIEKAEASRESWVQIQLAELDQQLERLHEPGEASFPFWLLQRIRCDLMHGEERRALLDLNNLLQLRADPQVLASAMTLLKGLEQPDSLADPGPVGLIWHDGQSGVLACNDGAELWLGLQPGSQLPCGLDQLPDIRRVQLPNAGYQWLHLVQQGELIVVRDLSHEQVENLICVLEQDCHTLCSELHDGPIQVVAARMQLQPTPELATLLDEMRETMGRCRSPLLDGRSLGQALLHACHHLLPDTDCRVDGEEPGASPGRRLAMYRWTMMLLEQLSVEASPQDLHIQMQPDQLTLRLDAGDTWPDIQLTGAVSQLLYPQLTVQGNCLSLRV